MFSNNNTRSTTSDLTAMYPYSTPSVSSSPFLPNWSGYPYTQFAYGYVPLQPMQQTLPDAVTGSREANSVPTSTEVVTESRAATSAPISRLRYLSQGTGWHRSDVHVFADDSRRQRVTKYAIGFLGDRVFSSPARENRKDQAFRSRLANFDPRAPF